mgnify:CR=1 FL=1
MRIRIVSIAIRLRFSSIRKVINKINDPQSHIYMKKHLAGLSRALGNSRPRQTDRLCQPAGYKKVFVVRIKVKPPGPPLSDVVPA